VTALEQVEGISELVRLTDPPVPVVAVCELPAELAMVPCLAAGASAFVRQPAENALVDQAIAVAVAGRRWVDPRDTEWLVQIALHGHMARTPDGLTARQFQVGHLVRAGLTNSEIARALGVSPETVKTHVQDILRRMGARTRSEVSLPGAPPPSSARPRRQRGPQ
jgi:DNA-binding NarL/FixJ family response regulator